jgi:hypothetical protein
MTIDETGNVGIGGAASATNKLKVTGTVEATTFTGSAASLNSFPTLNQNTTGSAATLTTAQYIGGVSFNGSAAIDLPGVNTAGNQNTTGTSGGITFTELDVTAPDATSGASIDSGSVWSVSASSDNWGPPKFDTTYNKYAYADYNTPAGTAVYRQWNIPTGMKSAYMSHLPWSNCGYVDVHGVRSDGALVFLRRVNTLQSVENDNHGGDHDGSTISFIGSGLDSFSSIRITLKAGRLHLTGLAFTPTLDGTEGTGMVHPQQLATTLSASQIPTLNQNTTGSAATAGDADTVDSLHASSFLRSDADDTVGAGVTYTWSATDTQGLVFKNSSYNTFLYLGGWAYTNSNDISRIRTSSGNLHIDSAANGNCYLNWYSGGSIQLGRNTTVRGYVDVGDVYCQYYIRMKGDTGIYWQGTSVGSGWHIYPKDRADMYMRTGSGNGGLAFCIADNNVRGYIHCTTSNEIGFLNSGRGWSLRMDNSNNCQVYGRMYASGSVSETMTARYYNVSGGNASYTTTRAISVYALQMMRCSEMQVTSDRRIKTDIVDVDDGSALELLRKIQPKTYGYVDTLEKGTKHVYGFIAQEIKELIPEAVDVGEGDLPNIYKHATIDIQANSITIKDFDTSTLNQTDSIIYIDQDDQRQTLKIKSIINSTQLEIEEDLEKLVETFKTSKMEEYTFTGEIFIWGQKVQDFHHLQKSAIFTVATAALQEVDRQLQAEKIKTYELRQKVELLEMSHGALIQRVEALEKL